jgi:hypothetical protein
MKSPDLSPRETLLWILVPLLLTIAVMRLFLHFVRVQHIYPGGYLVHHLFTGCLIVIPAAFVLAFGPRRRWSALLTRAALGAGSAMILDEMVYLIATGASDADYISAQSLNGALVFTALGTAVLLVLYHRSRR